MSALTDEQRKELKLRLIDAIQVAMYENYDLRLEAIVEGRVGLDEMSDEDLIELARDCYGIEVPA